MRSSRDTLVVTTTSVGALGGAIGAGLSTLCCAGPAVLAAIGAGGAVVGMKLEPFRWYLLGGAFLLLGLAFWRSYAPVKADGGACVTRTGRVARLTLWTSLGMTVLSAVLPFLMVAWGTTASAMVTDNHQDGARGAVTRSGLPPWEPIDETFRGCEGGCGLRGEDPHASVQRREMAAGQKTYCPVSGVVFTVTDESVRRSYGGQTFFFCCEGCARHFDTEPARILALRRIELHELH